jgi:hypothetical protein
MNEAKHLDSCIQILKGMRGDQSNELGSEQQRALSQVIGKLKKLKKQQNPSRDEVYRAVAEAAETVTKICNDSRPKRKSHS